MEYKKVYGNLILGYIFSEVYIIETHVQTIMIVRNHVANVYTSHNTGAGTGFRKGGGEFQFAVK